ncbi:hypothetical protein MMC07_007427 [Pseudocyphellaria aurata]|nr:hypothetical protein [Pseudocyphellaria aurata]
MSKFNRSQKKRPFQPSVDSFFHAIEETNSLDVTPYHESTATLTLPPAVQSSLLNVGMRVRKSVPEGYKTCAKSLACLSTDAESHHTRAAIEGPGRPVSFQSSQRSARPSELMPYCGLLHVGGHEDQPVVVNQDLAPLEFARDDSYESDHMSGQEQISIDPESPVTLCPRNKKRPLDLVGDSSDLQSVSSPLCPIGPTRLSDLNRIRPKLQPKAVVRRHLSRTEQECEWVGVDDFEEATFLRPKD